MPERYFENGKESRLLSETLSYLEANAVNGLLDLVKKLKMKFDELTN